MTRARTMCVLTCIMILAMQQELRSQNPDMECGVGCLFVALHTADDQCTVTLNELRQQLSPRDSENTLNDLRSAASAAGFQTLNLQTTLDALRVRTRPFACIAHLKSNHFVLLADIAEETVEVLDPPKKLTSVPVSTFSSAWSGSVLLVSKSPLEGEDVINQRLRWMKFRQRVVLGVKLLIAALAGFVVVRWGWKSASVQNLRSRFMAILLICVTWFYCGQDCMNALASEKSISDNPALTS